MDAITRKKVKTVLIAFCILMIPLGYLVAISYAIKIGSEAIDTAQMYSNDSNVLMKWIKQSVFIHGIIYSG